MLGHKTSLNKFTRTEIIQSMFTHHNGMKLGIKSRKKFGDLKKYVEINIHLNNWWRKKTRRKIRKNFEVNKNKKTTHQKLWDAAIAMLRGKFIAINTCVKKKTSNQ